MESEDSENSQNIIDNLNKLAPEQPKEIKKVEKKTIESLPKTISLNVMKQKRSRLVIDHMVLENFKSYEGRQVIGKFHGNFTSVVGPNGSGKSNLIQSMLFIFGFNASWMRLNKLNQLIHNSSTATGVARAAVQVHFKKIIQSDDGTMIEVPGSELWIRRTVNTSSVSKYFLQGKDSTQAEVKERLRAEGIDLGNNRFLILQGEVEQISQMKQKSGDSDKPGLLEYLEEIIGSNQFIERIEQCGREYAQTEQQKHEKGQLMKLVQNELKGMSKSKDEAVKYVKKQKKIYQIQNVLNQVQVSSAKEEGKRLRQLLSQFQKTKQRIMTEQRQKMRKQGERIRQIKRNKVEIDGLQSTLDKFQQVCNKLQVEDKHITQEVTFKSQDLVKFQRKIQDSDKQFSKIISSCQQIRQKLPKSTQILKIRNQKLDKMKLQLSKYQKPHLRQKIKDCEMNISKNQLQSNTLKNKYETIKESLNKMKSGKGDMEAKVKQYKQKVNDNVQVKEKIEKARGNAQKMIKQKTEKVSDLQRKKQEMRIQMRRIQTDLREQLNESQEQGQIGNMFRQIMQQGFPGVIGRLGDLGDVPKQYDQIITTACHRLDNIVVTDLQTATAVLDYLKKKRLGRTTCIILDKISQQRHYMNRPFQNLPRATRLFDIIKFKTEEAKLAFYFALSDTLYCQDSDLGLDYSMKNDHQRRRVICRNKNRNGYMIYEMNGLMVGSVAKRGGFQPKAAIKGKKKGKDEGTLRELQDRKKIISGQLQEISRRIEKEQNQIKTARQDLQQMKRQLDSVKDNIKQFDDEIKDLQQMIGKAEGRVSSTVNLERQIQAIQKQLSNLVQRKKQQENILTQLESEQRKNQNQEINQLREQYKKERAEVNKLQKQYERQKAVLETAIKRVDDIKNGKKDTQKNLERLKRQIDKLKNDQLNLQTKVSDIIGKMTASEEKLKECKKLDQQLRMMMEQDDKDVKQSKAKVQKVKKDVENCQENCRKQSEELKFAQSQLQRLRQNYRQLSASYSFLQHLDELQKMVVGGGSERYMADPPSPKNASILQTSMLNSSFDSNQPKVFEMDQILKTEPYQNLNEDQLQHFKFFKDKLTGMVTSQSAALKKMEGNNLDIINQFRTKFMQYRQRLGQFQAVKERQQQLKRLIDGLKNQRLKIFREGFGIINSKLKQVYQHLTRGGDAELELIDALDPFSDGVNFSVRPPKKSWKEVNKLSGGQKTLSSLSLIFALHYYKPTPLYFMDEIDAALDFKNVSIVAQYIKMRTKDAQFIIISLRNNMFDLANKLVGVYKTNDKTRVINLEPAKLLQQRFKENNELKSNTNASHK